MTNETQEKQLSSIDTDVTDILNIILKAGRSECECTFMAHIITKEVDKFFDHLNESHDVKQN